MSDSSNGGSAPGSDDPGPAPTPPPAGPPPRYAGDQGNLPAGFTAAPTTGPPAGTPGALGGATPPPVVGYDAPALGQVPMPGARTATTSKPHRNPIPVVLGVVAILVVAGAAFWFLTSDDDEEPAEAAGSPAAVVAGWWDAMADADYQAACESMSSVAVDRLTGPGGTCRERLEALNPDGLYDQGAETKVLATKIEGNKARVTIKAGGSPLPKQDMLVVREYGEWLVDPFGDATDLSPKPGDAPAEPESNEPTTTLTTITPQPGGPAEVFTAWVRALVKTDYDGACARLSKGTLDELASKGANCELTMAGAAEETRAIDGLLGDSVSVRILGESISGDRAEISYQLGSEPPSEEPAVLVRREGTWKLELFASSLGDGSIAGAQAAACRAELSTVETAVEAYKAENGAIPQETRVLVPRYLQEEPPNMRLEPDGTVTPINKCA